MSQHYRTIASSSVPGGAGVTLLERYRTALQHITLAKLSETDFMRAPLGLPAPLNTCESSVVENIVLPCWRSGSCFLLVWLQRTSTSWITKALLLLTGPPAPHSRAAPGHPVTFIRTMLRSVGGGGLTHYWVRL